VIATHSDRLIRAVTGLAITCIGVAGLYYYLLSPFVALMEMLIYVGAVCVTIVFAIMLADPKPEKEAEKGNVFTGPLSFVLGITLFWGLAALGSRTVWVLPTSRLNDGSLEEVGRSLLTNYSMVFELISIVLLVAIIGALVLARQGRTRTGGQS
jgi:NADH:ubiquinone oxidoreductase subunit 6 (subunit J)